jgi:hypothetical protein
MTSDSSLLSAIRSLISPVRVLTADGNQERCMYVCGANQEYIKSEDHLREEIKKFDFLVIFQIFDPEHLVRDIMFINLPRKERKKSVAACTFMEDLRM